MANKKKRPIAAVYRGPISCEGCPESLATLLRRSPPHFKVHYLGPDESHDVSASSLAGVDLFAWPGGGDDEDGDFLKVAHYTPAIRSFVKRGGLYLGVCLGAFLARGEGHREFFGLLPQGSFVAGERFQPGAQVKSDKDAIIQTDWNFYSGHKAGTTQKGRWQYFQDGGFIHFGQALPGSQIAARYSSTQDICAAVVPFHDGHVGLIGTHPEAERDWYEDWNGTNPDGIRFDIGEDFIWRLWTTSRIAKQDGAAASHQYPIQADLD